MTLSRLDIVDWDIKQQDKQTNFGESPRATFSVDRTEVKLDYALTFHMIG